MEVGEERGEIIYLSLHCHNQNDSCIKMGSDESHFNVLLSARDKVTGQCPQTTTLKRKGSQSRFEPRSLLYGVQRTCSQTAAIASRGIYRSDTGTTKQRCKHTTWVDIQNLFAHSKSHAARA